MSQSSQVETTQISNFSPASPSLANYRYIHVRKLLERPSSFAQEDFEPGNFNLSY